MRSDDDVGDELPEILTSKTLLERLKRNGGRMNPTTLWQLSHQDHRWAACVIRRTKHSTWWSTARLINAGILRAPAPARAEPIPGPGFTFTTQGVAHA